jgi:hypothetical protein
MHKSSRLVTGGNGIHTGRMSPAVIAVLWFGYFSQLLQWGECADPPPLPPAPGTKCGGGGTLACLLGGGGSPNSDDWGRKLSTLST